MAILPGFDEIVKPHLTNTQYVVFMTVHWLLIMFYAGLTGLVVINVWQILVK